MLTVKGSLWPLTIQMPEMLLLWSLPNKMTLAKAFFLSLSRRWNMPATTRTEEDKSDFSRALATIYEQVYRQL